jgi:hypothetical protein
LAEDAAELALLHAGWRMWKVEPNALGVPRLISPYVENPIVMPGHGVIESETGVYFWPLFKTADLADALPFLPADALTFGVAGGWLERDDDAEGQYGSLRAQRFKSHFILGDITGYPMPTLPLTASAMLTIERRTARLLRHF